MAETADLVRKPAPDGSPAQLATSGAHAATLAESPRIRALHAAGRTLNAGPAPAAAPVQRAEAAAPVHEAHEVHETHETGDPTAALHALIGRLAGLAGRAEALGDSQGLSQGHQLDDRLAALRKIAAGSDLALKREALSRLQAEMGTTPLPAAGKGPVQRITGLEIGAIVVGLGLLALGVLRLLERRPTTRLRLAGVGYDAQGSFASVISEAHLTNVNQRVRYYIRWDANVVPGGNHLQQRQGVASGWVIDRSPRGLVIGSRTNGMGGFFADPGFSNPNNNGLHFYFADGIDQRVLNNGSWWFRLQVQAPGGGVLSSSEVQVNWTH